MDKQETPTLEKAVRVLETAGFRVFDITYHPRHGVGQSMSEALAAGCGVINLSITPQEKS
jgi:hypothetical protein